MTISLLVDLHKLIGDSLRTLEEVYSSANVEFPQMNTPYNPDDKAEELLRSDQAVKASNIIVAAAEQLIASVKQPYISLCDSAMAYHLPACLSFAERANLAEILREAGPHGLHVSELAKRSGTDPVALEQILRLLASHYYFLEVTPGVFAESRLSSLLDTGKSLPDVIAQSNDKHKGTNGAAAFVSLAGDEMFKASAYLCNALNATNTSLATSSTVDSESSAITAFSLAHSISGSYFDWLQFPENQWRIERFSHAITGISLFELPEALEQAYDWNSLPQGSLVVDVGGGLGIATLRLAKAFPHLHFTIQDLPGVVSGCESFWLANYPDAWMSGRVTSLVHNFFDSQPAHNATIFLLRAVCNDFPDESVLKILRRLREAAQPNTILIVGNHIIPHACDETNPVYDLPGAKRRLAPPPLVANFGKGGATASYFDLTMRTMFNGSERTLEHIAELCHAVGWSPRNVSLNSVSRFGYVILYPQ